MPPLPAPPRRDPVDRERTADNDRIDIEGAIQLCLENFDLLSAWESGFVRSIAEQYRARGCLSAKQLAILDPIARGIIATVTAARRQRTAPPPRKSRHRRKRRAA